MDDTLLRVPLFRDIAPEDLSALLRCLGAGQRDFHKGDTILSEGTVTHHIGILLSGQALIQHSDAWGSNSLLGTVPPGGVFAESYACIPGQPLLISVTAVEDTQVLFLDITRVLSPCSSTCAFHTQLVRNLLSVCAEKSFQLSQRILHTASKSIRGRLMSYFSDCVKRAGSRSFQLPFGRQQLADYLGVDRSALCAELSKIQRDGLIRYRRNEIYVLETPED